MLTRSAFPVSLLYRTLEKFSGLFATSYCPVRLVRVPKSTASVAYCIQKFNDTFNFLLTSRFACVPINHYCVSDVQQNTVNLPLITVFYKVRVWCFSFIVLNLIYRASNSA